MSTTCPDGCSHGPSTRYLEEEEEEGTLTLAAGKNCLKSDRNLSMRPSSATLSFD